jgi:hypothetical protein
MPSVPWHVIGQWAERWQALRTLEEVQEFDPLHRDLVVGLRRQIAEAVKLYREGKGGEGKLTCLVAVGGDCEEFALFPDDHAEFRHREAVRLREWLDVHTSCLNEAANWSRLLEWVAKRPSVGERAVFTGDGPPALVVVIPQS